jgi:hypothetical protein
VINDLGVSPITQPASMYHASATWDAPSVAAGAQTSTTVTVTGASIGDFVEVSANGIFSGMRLWGEVSAANTVTVYLSNNTGGAVDPSSRTISVRVEERV